MDFSILDEFPFGDFLLDLFDRRKIVVHAVLLTRARMPSRVRDGEAKLVVWELLLELLNESALYSSDRGRV